MAINERGFALPITLFVIAILTLMLGSAFTRAATENQIAGSSKATVDALFVAQAGLQKYLGQDFTDLESPRPLSGDSVRMDVPGGWAWVVPDVLQTPADTMDNFRYIIRSTGYVVDPNDESTPLASRTVAQFADWQTPWLDAPSAALIAANGLDIKSEDVVLVDGVDQLNALCPGDPLLPAGFGARLPASSYNTDLDDADFTGSPDSLELGTPESVAQLVNIDWAAIRAGGFIADYSSPQDGLTGNFPSQLVAGDYEELLDVFSGEGLLIVTGDLRVRDERDSWKWRGVILVGGTARIEAEVVSIFGTLISGLNYLTGDEPTGRASEFRGDVDFLLRFDSCNIRKSLRFLRGFVPLKNTWIDNWATF